MAIHSGSFGTFSVGIFYLDKNDEAHYFARSKDLDSACYDLWSLFEGPNRWSTMTYILEQNGHFKIEYGYESILDLPGTRSQRRKEWIQKHIGAREVEYPKFG